MNMNRRVLAMPGILCLLLISVAARGAGTDDARDVLKLSGVKGGLVVHLGSGSGELTTALRGGDSFVVQGLDASDANVAAARERVRQAGLYGSVSIDGLAGDRLPYANDLVNLLVVSDAGQVAEVEMLRVLAPGGVLCRREAKGWSKTVKPWPDDIDEWSHFLHGPDNNAVGQDRRAGVPRSLQWVAGPRWGRSHEELASLSAAVTAGGRMYYIEDEAPMASIRFRGQWWLIARDAFNGVELWRRPIQTWTDHLRHFRSGPVHLPRRLVAQGNTLYVTRGLDGPVLALDGATGKTIREYAGTERTEEILCADGTLYLVLGTSEVDRKGGGLSDRDEPEPVSFRHIAAFDAATGKTRWREDVTSDGILPLTLALRGSRLFYQSRTAMVCREAQTGAEVWRTARATAAKRMGFSAPTLVVTRDVVLCADRTVGQGKGMIPEVAGDKPVEWAVHGWSEPGFSRKGSSTLVAYDAATGKELWSAPCQEGYNSPVDLFVVGDTVWIGPDFRGLNVRTGAVVGKVNTSAPRVGMAHHRCYRDKATEQFIFAGKSGIEVFSYDNGWLSNNSWVRGTCQYGIIPANGLVYAPPDACGCFLTVKSPGFVALAPKQHETPGMHFPAEPVLVKGPMYGAATGTSPRPGDWPMYRHDSARSGAGGSAVPEFLAASWSVSLGGRLTQPVVANGSVYLSSVDEQVVHALNEADGTRRWDFTAGGRVDSSPTVVDGLVVFGCADGWVYTVEASSGQLAWRFRAAPEERLICVEGQLESTWPVHGSVLAQNGSVYALAGRSSYLDGGLVLYRLEPATGKQLSRAVLYHLDPETGKQLTSERGFDMEGTTSDLLSGDGDQVFLKHFTFAADTQRTTTERPRMFSITSFLGEEWFVRSFWVIGNRVAGAGWGGWANTANEFQSGRILCTADDMVYGYGREKIASAAAGHRYDTYHLYAASLKGTATSDRKGEPRVVKSKPTWADRGSITVRAMALGGGRLAVAGPVDLSKKDREVMAFENEAESLAAFRGEKGILLRVVQASDGRRISETPIPAMSVFDGLSVANGNLYLACQDGSVNCFRPGAGKPLPAAVAVLPPVQEPLPPQGPMPNGQSPSAKPASAAPQLDGPSRAKEFVHVDAQALVKSPLGYRLAAEPGKVAFAIKELPAPLTKQATFTARMRPSADGRLPNRYENAYLAFGDGVGDEHLVKCGFKFILGNAVIITGPTAGGQVASIDAKADRKQNPEVKVTVDFATRTITMLAGGKEANTALPERIQSITHVGYALTNAISDFGPIGIEGE
jgi:outer membrane protein assembly factor BamB